MLSISTIVDSCVSAGKLTQNWIDKRYLTSYEINTECPPSSRRKWPHYPTFWNASQGFYEGNNSINYNISPAVREKTDRGIRRVYT